MGHSLPQALQAWGSFVYDLDSSTKFFVNQVYDFTPPPRSPLPNTRLKPKRNAEIRRLYADGETVPDLAKMFGLSKPRIYQILSGKHH